MFESSADEEVIVQVAGRDVGAPEVVHVDAQGVEDGHEQRCRAERAKPD